MGDAHPVDLSEGSWDPYIDNWADLYQEAEHELPKIQKDRRRLLAVVKLRMLVTKLDDDLNDTILKLGEREMERFIAMDGDDAAKGYLATARVRGVKAPPKDAKEVRRENRTERVQHIEMSKEMVGIFKRIVKKHQKQLYGAVHQLTIAQMDRIVRENHEKFSGGHRRGGKAKKASKCVVERAKGLDHEFATPRVKSAAKSREAVLQLNNIVYTKDNLLRKAIVSMDHKMRNALVTRNNDFIKFEALRKKQREEFDLAKKTVPFAEHHFATRRIKEVARARVASDTVEKTVRKKKKVASARIKRLTRNDRDLFLKKVNSPADDVRQRTTRVLAIQPAKACAKTLDASRYVRGEVMHLRRRVQGALTNAIHAKVKGLDEVVAEMDDDELERTLTDCIPSRADDMKLWRKDRRKQSWRRLSAFGRMRDDPSLYRQWKLRRHQVGSKDDSKGRACATDADLRQPWSTDLNYAHRCRPQPQLIVPWSKEDTDESKDAHTPNGPSIKAIKGPPVDRESAALSASFRSPRRRVPRTRPASAPSRSLQRITSRHVRRPDTARSPGLARLARVFYESSISSTALLSCATSGHPCGLANSTRDAAKWSPRDRQAQAAPGPPVCRGLEATGVSRRQPDEVSPPNGQPETAKAPEGGACLHRREEQHGIDLTSVKSRMEGVRLMWAVSQMSAEAVTNKVMYGYFARARAREPNRAKWTMTSKRPRPPPRRDNGVDSASFDRSERHQHISSRSEDYTSFSLAEGRSADTGPPPL